MTVDRAMTDELIDQMLQRRAMRGDTTDLERLVREAVDDIPQGRRRRWATPAAPVGGFRARRAIAAAAAACVVIVAGVALLGLPTAPSVIAPGTVSPPPSSPATSASPSSSVPPSLPDADVSRIFEPRLATVLPTEWSVAYEDRALLELTHADGPGIEIASNVFPATIDADGCPTAGLNMSLNAADRLVDSWTSNPRVDASTPEPIAIGSLEGWLVVLSEDTTEQVACPDATYPTNVGFLHLWDGLGAPFVNGISAEPKPWIVVDLPDGQTIGIEVTAAADLQEEVMSFVKSLEFD